jgi:fermentation-respiration switch protein FrsA (DUF1100 family)
LPVGLPTLDCAPRRTPCDAVKDARKTLIIDDRPSRGKRLAIHLAAPRRRCKPCTQRLAVPEVDGASPMSGRMNASLGRLVAPLALAVLLLLGSIAMFQDRLIYFPENPPLAALLAEARRHDLTPWPGEGDYRGLLRDPAGPVRGTLLLFHGNAGHAGHRDGYADELTGLGLRVILAEYPAYGSRPGRLGEAALVADAAKTLAMARRQFAGPLLLAGESLGAGVAAAVANSADVDAILLITPWDRIESIARHHYPWLPVGAFLRDRYDSVANLDGYRGRVAMVVAERDSIVPPRFALRLFASLSGPKRLWIVPAADHNDWMARVDGAWWQSVISLLLDG